MKDNACIAFGLVDEIVLYGCMVGTQNTCEIPAQDGQKQYYYDGTFSTQGTNRRCCPRHVTGYLCRGITFEMDPTKNPFRAIAIHHQHRYIAL